MLTLHQLLQYDSPNDTVNIKRLLRDTLVELVATTVFVFNGTLSVVSTGRKLAAQGSSEDVGRIMPIAFSFGISIMTLAYAIGHLSGGHMNPAVSLLMFFRRQISATKMAVYWIAQFLGAALGASLTWGCVSNLSGSPKFLGSVYHRPPFELGSTTVDSFLTTSNAFLLEFMGAFFFFFVIAQTALDKKGISNSMFPAIPIGFSLIVVHICLIPFTGCGVNPARTFGPSMVVCMAGGACDAVTDPNWYWIYYVAPFLAAYATSEVTLLLEMDIDDKPADHDQARRKRAQSHDTAEELFDGNFSGDNKVTVIPISQV